MPYETLAGSYDRLTHDVPYGEILGFYKALWARYGLRPKTALDLACGTGSMALLLAKEGLQTLGADAAEEMLTVAADRAAALERPPYFVRQKMQRLRLPTPVDFVCCCLDGINYLTDPADCRETFRRVFGALTPGGLFVFDLNTEAKLRGLDGQILLDEDDDVFCLWRVDYSADTRLCRYGIELFERRGALWERSREAHYEYAYRAEEIAAWLSDAGFTDVSIFADRKLTPPSETEQRIFLAAKKPSP